MTCRQGLKTLQDSGATRAPRGSWTRWGVLAMLLTLCLLAPGARADVAFEWATAMGGTSWDQGFDIAVDGAGNVYSTGAFRGTADFGTFRLTAAGDRDSFVVKQAPDGAILWARSLGGTDYVVGNSIAVDDAGNVYTTGYFQGTADFDPGAGSYNLTATGFQDIFVSKLDNHGNFVWAHGMGSASDFAEGLAIAVDGEGNVYTTGFFTRTTDFDPGPGTVELTSAGIQDIFVQKLDTEGHFVWARSLGGVDGDRGNSIAVDDAGNVYTTGWFRGTADFDPGPDIFELTSAGLNDTFVQKLDANGDFVWARATGGTQDDKGRDIAVDAAGNVYTTGSFRDTMDFDPGPGDFTLTSAGLDDIFVQKLDAEGHFVWARAMGGTNGAGGLGIAVDGEGNVYTTGSFWGTTDFDPGPDAFNLTSEGFGDIFVQKLDADGHFVWARAMGGTNFAGGMGIAVNGTGSVYTTGHFSHTVDFDPGPDFASRTSAGREDIFIVKFSAPLNVISITPSSPGPTNASSVDFAVAFDEAVVHFDDASDLVISHTGTASTGATITGGPEVYTVTIEGISGDGSFTLAVNIGSNVTDLAGNPLASSVTSAPVVIDNTPPSITALTVSPSALEPGDMALIRFDVSEMILGDPLVQVAGTSAEVAPLEVVKSLAHSYTWTVPADMPVGRITGRTLVPGVGYFNPDPWPYGPQTLEITLTDLAGNTITHTETEGLALVSGLPLAWPGLAVLAMLLAAAFAFRSRRMIRSR